ncbi:MAG: Na+/H+ antiporter subunit E [Thermodesulfobacteriota bacterium]
MAYRFVMWLRFLGILTREIWWSAVTVAKLVFAPVERLRSGFLAIRMDVRSDLGITTLANAITLTPGTITVHVEPTKHTIVIHAIEIGHDPDEVRQSIKTVLEANILRWSRPGDGSR